MSGYSERIVPGRLMGMELLSHSEIAMPTRLSKVRLQARATLAVARERTTDTRLKKNYTGILPEVLLDNPPMLCSLDIDDFKMRLDQLW